MDLATAVGKSIIYFQVGTCAAGVFDGCLISVVQLGLQVVERFSRGAVGALRCLDRAAPKQQRQQKHSRVNRASALCRRIESFL